MNSPKLEKRSDDVHKHAFLQAKIVCSGAPCASKLDLLHRV